MKSRSGGEPDRDLGGDDQGRKTARNRLSLLTLLLLKFEQALFPAIRALLLLFCSESHSLPVEAIHWGVLRKPIRAKARYGILTDDP